MLDKTNAMATMTVKSLSTAKNFYETKLGLSPIGTDKKTYITYKTGTGRLLIYKSDVAGHGMATWHVGEDIKDIINRLKLGGMKFEHYNILNATWHGDINECSETKKAWCKDPDGNVICISSE